MKKTIKFFKSRTGKAILFWSIWLALLTATFWCMHTKNIYILIGILISIFFIWIFITVYPDKKNATSFYGVNGKFEVYDVVYDRGSATRPSVPGVLKNDGEGWFIMYEDGFEWPMSDNNNIEKYILKPKK